MNKNTIIIIVIILILLISSYMAKEPIKKFLSRGYQNNNPGNIRLTADKWQGEITGKDKAFKTFSTLAYGFRAIFVLLRTYINSGVNTIEKIISKYAPSNENNTKAYIDFVSKKTGIASNKPVSFSDIASVAKIVEAIAQMENGVQPDKTEIQKGYNLL